ncbi:MAG: polysaccharide biosynthesis tyrosine autokinase [Candidatus Brocadiia bacterium]
MPADIDIDLSEQWQVILRRKGWAIATFVGVLIGVIAVTLRQEPLWKSGAVLRISAREPMATMKGESIVWYGMQGGLETEIQMIEQSNEIHRKAVQLLKNKDELREEIKGISTGDIRAAVSAEQVARSDLVQIITKGPNRAYVALVADAMAEAYKEEYIESRSHEARKTVQLLRKSLNGVITKLEKTEETAQRLEKADVRLGTAATYRTRIATLDKELARKRQEYTDKHPEVQKLFEERKELKAILQSIPEKQLQYSQAVAERDRLRELRNQLTMQLHAAEIDHASKRESAAQKIDIVAKAGGPDGSASKIRPSVGMNIGIGGLLGIVSAIMMCFLVETFDTSIGRVEDIEERTGLPVLALIPHSGPKSHNPFSSKKNSSDKNGEMLRKRMVCNLPSESPEVECYRSLREATFSALEEDDGRNVLMITSAAPREGKTLITANLAMLAVQMDKKVLLLEAEMRNPSIHRLLGVSRSPGLSDLLLGQTPPEKCTRGIVDLLMGFKEWDDLLSLPNIEKLHVLTAGTEMPNPAELIGSSRMEELIKHVSLEYDIVYVDTPPVIPVVDTLALGKTVPKALMVYTVGGVSRHLLLRALKLMEGKGMDVLGIVLNQIESDVHLPPYYKRAYGERYGYPGNGSD